MKVIQEETQKLELNQTLGNEEFEFYSTSFNSETNILKRIFLQHIQEYMNYVYNRLIKEGIKFTLKHAPPLDQNQQIDNFDNILSLKELDKWTLFKLFFLAKRQRLKFFLICFVLFIFSVSKCLISILISTIIESLSSDLGTLYGYGVALVLCNLISIICQHLFYSMGYEYSTLVRMNMANILYQKIFRLNTYQIKNTNQGRIINMISTDLNILEPYLIYMFVVFNLPFALIMSSAILWIRFEGPQGLLLIAILMIQYPVQMFLTHKMTIYIKKTKELADLRIKLANEFIEGIRLIKMYAWEQAFQVIIKVYAHQEHRQYLYVHLTYVFLRGITFFSQLWATAVFFIILHYGSLFELNMQIMLSTLQLTAFVRFFCVALSSFGLDFLANLRIVLDRIKTILLIPEIVLENNTTIPEKGIILRGFKGYWSSHEQQPTIQISYSFKQGLYAVVGKIGCGKSSFLSALLGEMPKTEGELYFNGEKSRQNTKIGYVEQEPFIFPASFRENVIFGRIVDEIRYSEVLEQSCLIKDLELMDKGDNTMIGEKGLTLSGGQKARLSLARALYENGDILLLDDPLSAVDSKVSRKIFMNLKKVAQNKIIILVTHQIQFVPECDEIIIMHEGSIQASGDFTQVGKHFNLTMDKFDQEQQINQYHNPITKQDNNELYKKEESTSIPVTFQTYKRFLQQWDYSILLIFIIIFNLGQETILQFYFKTISQFNNQSNFYFTIGMFCCGALILNIVKYTLTTIGVLSGNSRTHDQMLDKICIVPINYFDTNPSGRILNRFSNDKSLCDYALNLALWEVFELNAYFFVSIAFLISILPYFALIMFGVIILQIFILLRSYKIVIETKECDSIQRSPLFDFFKNTLNGIVQIKLYKQEQYFKSFFNSLTNNCIRANLTFYQCSTNFGYKIHLIGWLASAIGTMLILAIYRDESQVFSQALLILTIFNDQFQWCMRQMIQVHAMMSSIQRMYEIVDLLPEAPAFKDNDPINWPQQGRVEFLDIKLRYRSSTPLVLKGISFTIPSGKRVGCIGRTGAGKSSILQALFRMSEPEYGQILIDGIDVLKIGLNKLRSSIGIIPQSPFLFGGTIRRNLDPLQQYTESELYQALTETSLDEYIRQMPKGLDTDMTQVNSVFSVGQKQLICLARVVLSKKKLVVLDEATASLDQKTDDFIQNAIKRFSATVLTIAHRLNTIADYDYVMVIGDGVVKEFGKPLELLCEKETDLEVTKNTEFGQMVKATGAENSRLIVQLAKGL